MSAVPSKRVKREDDIPIPELLANKQYYPLIAGPGALKAHAVQTSFAKLTVEQQDAIAKAKKYAMEQSIKCVLEKQTVAHQLKTVQKHQALVLMCRIYIGSISFELREDAVKNAFTPFGPIKVINMSFDSQTQKHKGFAFVEFEIPEAAHMALEQMNGHFMGGRNIKVGRPSNIPQALAVIEQLQQDALNYNRIYISSIHSELCEKDIKSVFEAFGAIKTCHLPEGPNGKHRGFGFIEYQTEQSMVEAIAAMNMFDLAGQNLRVCRAVTPPDVVEVTPTTPTSLPTAAAIAAAAVTAKIQAMDAVGSNGALAAATAAINSNPAFSSSFGSKGVLASSQPGLITGVTITPNSQPVAAIPPPALVTTLPLALKKFSNNGNHPEHQSPNNGTSPLNSISGDTRHFNGVDAKVEKVEQTHDETQSLQQQEGVVIKGSSARQVLMHKLMRKNESRVCVLRNMVGPEEVDDDLEAEVTDECGKFGAVRRVIIYQEKQSEDDDAEVLVKIFVEFTCLMDAIKARDSLNGRFFGGRKLKAELYDQILYDDNDLSA